MKGIWVILLVAYTASCDTDIPEDNSPESRNVERQDGITVTVDTVTTEYEYEFDIKM